MNSYKEQLNTLLEEYKIVSAEILARHHHRYHFHYISIVIVGAALATYSQFDDFQFKHIVLLIIPIILFPVLMLELRERLYIDLRTHYIASNLKPRIESIFKNIEKDQSDLPEMLDWEVWERNIVWQSGKKKYLFAFLGLMNYGLPLLFSAISVFTFHFVVSKWNFLYKVLFMIDVSIIVIAFLLIVFISRWATKLQ